MIPALVAIIILKVFIVVEISVLIILIVAQEHVQQDIVPVVHLLHQINNVVKVLVQKILIVFQVSAQTKYAMAAQLKLDSSVIWLHALMTLTVPLKIVLMEFVKVVITQHQAYTVIIKPVMTIQTVYQAHV